MAYIKEALKKRILSDPIIQTAVEADIEEMKLAYKEAPEDFIQTKDTIAPGTGVKSLNIGRELMMLTLTRYPELDTNIDGKNVTGKVLKELYPHTQITRVL